MYTNNTYWHHSQQSEHHGPRKKDHKTSSMDEQHLPCKTTMSQVQRRIKQKSINQKRKELQLGQLTKIHVSTLRMAISELLSYSHVSTSKFLQSKCMVKVNHGSDQQRGMNFQLIIILYSVCTLNPKTCGDWSIKKICRIFMLKFLHYLHHVGIDTNRDRSISNKPSCHFCNDIVMMLLIHEWLQISRGA